MGVNEFPQVTSTFSAGNRGNVGHQDVVPSLPLSTVNPTGLQFSSSVRRSVYTELPFNSSFGISEHTEVPFNSSFGITEPTFVVPENCVVQKLLDFVPWDNPDNIISQEVEEIIDTITSVVFVNLLYFISAPTNVLNMMVFIRQGIKERMNLCLFFQSLSDLAFMTTSFLFMSDRIYLLATGRGRRGPIAIFVGANYLVGLNGFIWASGFMTTVIACERCFCVVNPLRSQHILKTKSMLAIILVAFTLIIGSFFVIGTRWSLVCVFNPQTGFSAFQLYPSQFYFRNQKLIDTLESVVYGTALPGTFLVAVIVSTIVTVVKLKRMASWREKASTVAMPVRDVALTRMLIGCSILFIVCTVPIFVFRTVFLFIPDLRLGGRYTNIYTLINISSRLLAYINSSFNFFIYYTMGTKYRKTLSSLCCRRRKAKPSPTRVDSVVSTTVQRLVTKTVAPK